MLHAECVTDPAEIERLYHSALLEPSDHEAHCATEVPYIGLQAVLDLIAERSVLVAVYDDDTPLVFAVVWEETGQGEWIMFCREPSICFAGDPSPMLVLVQGVIDACGWYVGKVENTTLRDLFATIPGVTLDGLEVKTWRKV